MLGALEILTVLVVAVAMALSSGVKGLEAAAVVTDAPDGLDVNVVRHLAGAAIPVVVANGTGEVRDVVHT